MPDLLPDNLNNPEALLDEGARFYLSQSDTEALAEYERVLAAAPRDREALIGLAETFHRLGRLEEALSAWQRVIVVAPGLAEAYINQGNVLYDLHRYDDALARYIRALQRDPHSALAHKQSGRALVRLARHEEALAAFEQAGQLAPDDVSIVVGQAVALEKLERFDQALAAYTRAVQQDPGDARVTYYTGLLLLRRRGARAAQSLAKRVLAVNQRNPGAWLVQAEALMGTGSYQAALAAYEHAIQLAPADRRGYQGKARALACLGRHRESDDVLWQARELDT